MAIQFQRLATPGEGVNTLLDFAPLAGAIGDYQTTRKSQLIGDAARTGGNTAAAQEAMKQGQLDTGAQYQRLAQQDTDRATQSKDKQIKILGAGAKAALYEKDPTRGQAIWNRVIQAAGVNPAEMDPEELDWQTGPKAFMAMAGMTEDPLDRQLKEAQIQKYQADARDGGSAYGKSGSIFQDPQTGQFFSVQFGADGSRKIEPLQANGSNLTPSRGVDVVGDTVINKATGADVRNVGGAIERGEFAKGRGQDNADFVTKFPKVTGAYKSFVQKSDGVMPVLDRAIANIGPNTTGWGALLSSLPESAARELQGDIRTIEANLAFGELQDMRNNSPTGGALGAVTERELALLSSTQAALDQLQSGTRLKENLQIIKRNWGEIRRLRSEAYAADEQRFRSLSGSQQQTQQPTNAPSGDPLQQARDAIARGADRNAVIQRLQQNGIDPAGL
jgi:hypothetical protein